MNDSITMGISVPTDEDGYFLLQCAHCGAYFKIIAEDCESDEILNLHCPSCGLVSEHYFTKEVLDLAETMTQNYANDLVYKKIKQIERKSRKENLKLKTGNKPKHEPVNPIHSTIDTMGIVSFPCCGKTAKIKPLLQMTGCYCPFCGVKGYDIE